MKLLIAEKPSVACGAYKELLETAEGERFTRQDGYLQGRSHIISWCVGHLVGLAPPEAYGWGWKLDDLPFIPPKWKYQVLPGTKKQFKILEGLCKSADLIIAGGDAGREGQLITDLVVMMAGCKDKPQKRLWVNSFDLPSLTKAWAALKPGVDYKPLGQAAAMRSYSDWIVGMTATVGYSVGTGQRGLSVGRVQTPTLALVVKRDLEIENWVPSHNFNLIGEWGNWPFKYFKDKEALFETDNELIKVRTDCEGKPAELTKHDINEKKQNPPKPFDLTELQKEANRKLGLKAADTLSLTQALYEAKLVSYPRTDSQYLPTSMKSDVFEILNKVASVDEKVFMRGESETFAFFNSAKVTDHYAIIPTGAQKIGGEKALGDKEAKVYKLIRDRFVQAFMKPYLYKEHDMEIICQGHRFTSKAKVETNRGFKACSPLSQESKDNTEEGGGEADNVIVNGTFSIEECKVGQVFPLKNLGIKKVEATKPSHYTEATLLTAMGTAGRVIEDEDMREAMKERGLGTPATKAAIMERLKKVGYIEAQKKAIISTQKGRGLIAMVDEKIKSPEMTGEWEFKLNEMAKGKYDAKKFKDEIVEYINSLTPSYTSDKAAQFSDDLIADNLTCPKCKSAKLIQNPKIIKCSDDKCGFILWPKMAGKKLTKKNIEDLLTKGKTGVIKGFKSKAGKPFDAALALKGDKVEMIF